MCCSSDAAAPPTHRRMSTSVGSIRSIGSAFDPSVHPAV
jgi:hypothetical protein